MLLLRTGGDFVATGHSISWSIYTSTSLTEFMHQVGSYRTTTTLQFKEFFTYNFALLLNLSVIPRYYDEELMNKRKLSVVYRSCCNYSARKKNNYSLAWHLFRAWCYNSAYLLFEKSMIVWVLPSFRSKWHINYNNYVAWMIWRGGANHIGLNLVWNLYLLAYLCLCYSHVSAREPS